MRKLGGVPAPHRKNTAHCVPQPIPVPPEVKLSMAMHSGTPANPVVTTGQYVKVGQLIGEADETVSSPVHASVSGTVKGFDYIDSLTGKKITSVTIVSDGNQTLYEGIKPPAVTNLDEFLDAVKNSGAVGLGGAGYPTSHKLKLRDYSKLDYILVNGMECEPYVTSDTRTMVDDAGYVYEGARLLREFLKPKRIIICIENNKPEAIKKLRSICKNGVEVRAYASLYPRGERKVLVHNVTGRTVPEGARLTDVGCIVINCTTVATIAKYIKTGMPLVSKYVTVDGSAVREPKNVIAPIGTPVRYLFDFCGGLRDDVKKIILGGPMMGAAIPNLDVPVKKVTGAVLAFSEKDSNPPESSACIRCGRCVSKCPIGLMPPFIENAYELEKPGLLMKYRVYMCAECGCCAYLCPAKRPLVQVLALARIMLKNYMAEQKEAK